MKKQIPFQKLTVLAALGAAIFATGCASTGVARNGSTDTYAAANVGGPNDAYVASSAGVEVAGPADDLTYESTKSALSLGPVTEAKVLPKWPLEWNMKVIETYTFAVPEPGVQVTAASTTLPTFNENLPPGSLFVEAAGADRPARVYRIIEHSPNPR